MLVFAHYPPPRHCARCLTYITSFSSSPLPHGFCSNDSIQWNKEKEGGWGKPLFKPLQCCWGGAVWGGCVATGSMNLIIAFFPQWSSLLTPELCNFSHKCTEDRGGCISPPRGTPLGEERKPGKGMEGPWFPLPSGRGGRARHEWGCVVSRSPHNL